MQRKDIKSLYYITHKDNVSKILKYGIYSHSKVQQKVGHYTKIYDEDVISIRQDKQLPNGDFLPDFVNLYFQPRNPMMYRLLYDKGIKTGGRDNIVLLELKQDILDIDDSYIATLNAAVKNAEFYSDITKGLAKINKIVLNDHAYWNDLVDGKAKIMAELLVKNHISANYINSIYTDNPSVTEQLKSEANSNNVNIITDRTKFFYPNKTYSLTNYISLVEGDMFFSTAQTMTISVNTVGIMGKGLASRTKYQFPDVYVEYQDVCRNKKLRIDKPYLVKREKSMDEVLAYQPETMKQKNASKWFLLFATKRHWKKNSELNDIEKGLQWLVKNYQKEGITSLALPALGCGLGQLSWTTVGPLMCRYLNQMQIRTIIYLPMGVKVPANQLTSNFLLSHP